MLYTWDQSPVASSIAHSHHSNAYYIPCDNVILCVKQETKNKLLQVTQKLKEAREEGHQIRADCQAMIKQYQVRFQVALLLDQGYSH